MIKNNPSFTKSFRKNVKPHHWYLIKRIQPPIKSNPNTLNLKVRQVLTSHPWVMTSGSWLEPALPTWSKDVDISLNRNKSHEKQSDGQIESALKHAAFYQMA